MKTILNVFQKDIQMINIEQRRRISDNNDGSPSPVAIFIKEIAILTEEAYSPVILKKEIEQRIKKIPNFQRTRFGQFGAYCYAIDTLFSKTSYQLGSLQAAHMDDLSRLQIETQKDLSHKQKQLRQLNNDIKMYQEKVEEFQRQANDYQMKTHYYKERLERREKELSKLKENLAQALACLQSGEKNTQRELYVALQQTKLLQSNQDELKETVYSLRNKNEGLMQHNCQLKKENEVLSLEYHAFLKKCTQQQQEIAELQRQLYEYETKDRSHFTLRQDPKTKSTLTPTMCSV